jgi:adenosine deaminase
MLADLHVHLLGMGSVTFWRQQCERHEEVLLDGKQLERAGVALPRTGRLRAGELARLSPALQQALVLSAPCPGRFDSDFSARFLVRQALAEQRPAVLFDLVLEAAREYQREGVVYAELSVGAGWLSPSHGPTIEKAIAAAEARHGVVFRLLAAFNRKHVDPRIHDSAYLATLAARGDTKLAHTSEPHRYARHLRELAELERSLSLAPTLRALVVGFDYMGPEVDRPYTPFLLPEFLAFAAAMRRQNPNFGFRLHLGEGVASSVDAGYVALRLGEHYVSCLAAEGYRVRAGHGLGLLGLAESAYSRWATRYPRARAKHAAGIDASVRGTTIEINLTSNFFLLDDLTGSSSPSRELAEHVMGKLADRGYRLVLGTDDPGIFPGVSLRSELALAARHHHVRTRSAALALTHQAMIASFADRATRPHPAVSCRSRCRLAGDP